MIQQWLYLKLSLFSTLSAKKIRTPPVQLWGWTGGVPFLTVKPSLGKDLSF